MKKFDHQEWISRNNIQILDSLPAGWSFIKGAMTAPKGYKWACNRKSPFSKEGRSALVRTGEGDALRSAAGGEGTDETSVAR